MAKKKEITDTASKELVNVTPAGELAVQENIFEAMQDDAGAGLENVTADDIALPFIMILQSGSPQLKRGETKIEGANEGDIFNSVTNVVFKGDEGIYVIPCAYKKAYVEWTPRESGGGFVRQHDSADVLNETSKNDKGQDTLPNGNIIVTTGYHYILIVDPVTGDYSPGIIAFTSTQLKKSRKWNSVMTSLTLPGKYGRFTPPSYSHIYHIITEGEHNDIGAWSGWRISIHSQVPTMELYNAAKKFATDISKGLIKEAIPPTQQVDENVPF